ncbi:MAG: hypothetical protein II283_02795 [Alistipes sp.]|nr:hypothetical protein [Alistipes sp.]
MCRGYKSQHRYSKVKFACKWQKLCVEPKIITTSIDSKSDDPLIGLGVLFELMWNNSNNDTKNTILTNIKKGLN